MDNYASAEQVIEIDKRLLVVETEQNGMKSDIIEIKTSLKESRYLIMTTLISSLLGLVAIVISMIR